MPANGGQAVQLTHDGGTAPRESPDGRFVYYVKSYDSEARCGGYRPKVGKESSYTAVAFTSAASLCSRNGIYFAGHTGRSSGAHLQFLSFDSGEVRQIAEFSIFRAERITVSPDQRSLLYSEVEYGADLMLVEDFCWPE